MITFEREALDQLFNYRPAGKTYLGDDFDEYWWRDLVGDNEGYLIIWTDGTTHHTYHNPENLFG